MTTDDFTTAARAVGADPEEVRESMRNATEHAVSTGLSDSEFLLWVWHAGAVWARDHLAAQEPTDAEVEAARAAYWPAYSAAVRNAPSNRPGQGISAEDGRKAVLAGHRAALTAARAVGRGAR